MDIGIVWENVVSLISEYRTPLVGVVLLVITYKGYSHYWMQKQRKKWESYGNDVVILHGLASKGIPSVSPFVMKVELFLKMAKIKYVFETACVVGSKTKFPWITLNGEDCCDSDLIFDFLKRKFPHVDLNSRLSTEQKATARAFQIMADEHIFWGLALDRFYFDQGKEVSKFWYPPWYFTLLIRLFGRAFLKRSKVQGIGLHSKPEIESLIRKDIEAVSLYLGTKKYIMGAHPSEVDCAIFGFMSQFLWIDTTSPYAKMIHKDYGNIVEYCYTVKSNLWPNWKECCGKRNLK